MPNKPKFYGISIGSPEHPHVVSLYRHQLQGLIKRLQELEASQDGGSVHIEIDEHGIAAKPQRRSRAEKEAEMRDRK